MALRALWNKYEHFVKDIHAVNYNSEESDISVWKQRLFISLLTYTFPLSFIAVIPGVILAIINNKLPIAFVDLLCLTLLGLIVFSSKLSLRHSKIVFVSTFYCLSGFLINALGYFGPGVFYLFGITIIVALILPIRFAYFSIGINAFILAVFALIIYYKPFPSVLQSQYSVGVWITFGSNLIFLSIVLVVVIHRIFNGLQSTIKAKDLLQIKYKSIFQSSPTPMWLFDPHSLRFLEVNEAAINHYGFTKAAFLSMTIKDIRPVNRVSEVENIVKINRNNSKFKTYDIVHQKKNGELINVSIKSSLIDFNGNSAKLVLATDITAQLKADTELEINNKKLKESEFNLRAIFESSIDGFMLIDREFIIKAFNAHAKNSIIIKNTSNDFETGQNIFNYIEENRTKLFYKLLMRVFNGENIEYDRRYHQPDKTLFWVHYNLTPVYEGENITGVCITGRDITAHKNYVQTIEKQNKTLLEISWIQSHLVRAPLARLMGLTSLLVNNKAEDCEEILNFITESSSELDDIIRTITLKTSSIAQHINTPTNLNGLQNNAQRVESEVNYQ